MVHQSNAYFERCHSADYDPTVQANIRQACWAAWLEHYTGGQPPERLEYARRRLRALEEGITVPPLPGLPSSALGSSHTASFLVTSSSSSTEQVLPSAVPQSPAAPTADDGAARLEVCAPERVRCRDACDSAGCHDACIAEYRTCLRGLY